VDGVFLQLGISSLFLRRLSSGGGGSSRCRQGTGGSDGLMLCGGGEDSPRGGARTKESKKSHFVFVFVFCYFGSEVSFCILLVLTFYEQAGASALLRCESIVST
jgi:hypothetical protein